MQENRDIENIEKQEICRYRKYRDIGDIEI